MSLLDGVDTIPVAIDAEGVIRVAETRVTLETLVEAFQDGAAAKEIAQQYPSVSLGDIYQVIGYYLHHTAEVDAYVLRASVLPRLFGRRMNTAGTRKLLA
jgi:uncharacterized protein (DUF433 family)